MNTPSTLGKSIVNTYGSLRAEREPLDTKYDEVYRFTCPALNPGFRGQQDTDAVTRSQRADVDTAELFDTTATDAARTLASAVLSSLTPPNVRWFNLEPQGVETKNLSQKAKQWLDDAATILHKKIHGSNYDAVALEFATHLVTAGISGLNIDLKNNEFLFGSWPISTLYVQEMLGNGFVDAVYFKERMTGAELVKEFGESALPQYAAEEYAKDPYSNKKHDVFIAVRPRLKGGKQSSGKQRRNLPYESVYALKCGTVLKESGFHEMPTVVPRWLVIPGTPYARGPVYDALPAIKMVNKITELMLINADMVINGAWGALDDGVLNPNTTRVTPRSIIPMTSKDALWNLNAGGDIQFAVDQIALGQGNIRRMLLSDQLGPTEKTIQTAAEVQARTNQVRQILGPVFARLQSEYLTKLIERCFGLALRAGILGEPPEDLNEVILNIKYSSPLARAQQLTEVDAIDQVIGRLQPMMQANPEVMDNFDFDKAARKTAELVGLPPDLLREEREVEQIRADRAKASAEVAQANQDQELQLIAAKNQKAPVEPTQMPVF